MQVVGVTGVEPVTSSLSGMRSNQLSYTPFLLVSGFRYNYEFNQHLKKVVEVNGIEPMTS